ncbi:MAG: hypothetical protein Q7U77_13680, partial [Sediminibacterium sp.]|uniref:hypothetical protein n=1 Tax=Sediminibacterium sp. TaxID=1917865 RepID=UPI0027166E62
GLITRVFQRRSLKIENPVWDKVQIPVIHPSKIVKLESVLAEPKTEKLRLGKRIENAASFLRKLRIF